MHGKEKISVVQRQWWPGLQSHTLRGLGPSSIIFILPLFPVYPLKNLQQFFVLTPTYVACMK